MRSLRIALFSDSHYEANGVARTTSALENYASERGLHLLSVHAGPVTRATRDRSIDRLELRRWMPTSFGLEHDLSFDVALWRHVKRVRQALIRFRPDVLHFTGPSDIGQLGVFLGYRLKLPMVGSWHTNLHEYASRRLTLPWIPSRLRQRVRSLAERRSLDICLLFYRIPRLILAPNEELAGLLEAGTGRPVVRMTRGVDVEHFTPVKRCRTDGLVNVGYVGRLSPEKSVRVLAALADALVADGLASQVRFTIVGEGAEREWLQQRLPNATFTGVLRGEDLATAYANMDLFVCPSQTETVGNVVLEALASGVPVVAMAQGGPRFVVGPGSAVLVDDHAMMIDRVRSLVNDPGQRSALSAAARSWALSRSWDSVFDNVYRAYATAVDLAGTPDSGEPRNAVAAEQCAES